MKKIFKVLCLFLSIFMLSSCELLDSLFNNYEIDQEAEEQKQDGVKYYTLNIEGNNVSYKFDFNQYHYILNKDNDNYLKKLDKKLFNQLLNGSDAVFISYTKMYESSETYVKNLLQEQDKFAILYNYSTKNLNNTTSLSDGMFAFIKDINTYLVDYSFDELKSLSFDEIGVLFSNLSTQAKAKFNAYNVYDYSNSLDNIKEVAVNYIKNSLHINDASKDKINIKVVKVSGVYSYLIRYVSETKFVYFETINENILENTVINVDMPEYDLTEVYTTYKAYQEEVTEPVVDDVCNKILGSKYYYLRQYIYEHLQYDGMIKIMTKNVQNESTILEYSRIRLELESEDIRYCSYDLYAKSNMSFYLAYFVDKSNNFYFVIGNSQSAEPMKLYENGINKPFEINCSNYDFSMSTISYLTGSGQH